MGCPVCIVDGIIIVSCRYFGVPDVITSYLLGVLVLSMSILTNRYIKSKLLLEKTLKYSLVVVLSIYTIITLGSMKLLGMW